MSAKNNSYAIIAAFLAFVVLLYGVNLPFAGQHDWNSVMYSNIARNHLRYGLLATKLGMATNFGQLLPGEALGFFTHYPPLMPLLLTGSFAVFGITEWAARLVPILSAAVMIYFLFRLAERLWNTATAVIASLFAVFSPMLLYYSKIPVHETIVLGFLAMTFWGYVRWLQTGFPRFYWFTLISLILSQLTSWAGYYLSLYLPLHALMFARIRNRRRLLVIFLVAPIMFLLHNLHAYWLSGSEAQQSLWEVFLFRLNANPAAQAYGMTLGKFIVREASWISLYFTRIMTILSGLWLLQFLSRRIRYLPISFSESIILLLLVFGFTHNLIFRHLAYIHDYMLIYTLPFFAISSAIALMTIYRYFQNKSIYAPALIALVLVLFSVERLAYVQKLFQTGQVNPAVPLGKILFSHTPPQARIAITSVEFMRYYDVFVSYYADRRIAATTSIKPEDLIDFDYLVIPKIHDLITPQGKQKLFQAYAYVDTPEGLIFNLHQVP